MTNRIKQLLADIEGKGRREQEMAYFFQGLYGSKPLTRLFAGHVKHFARKLKQGKFKPA